MAQVSYNKTGGVIYYDKDDWEYGLIPEWSFSVSPLRNRGMQYTRGVDPYRIPGLLMPGPNPIDATNDSAVDAILRGADVYATKGYLVGGTKLHEYTILTNTITNGGSFPHTIVSAVTAYDCAVYKVGTTPYLFYSYAASSNGNIGRYDLSSSFDDDYMSTVPASAATLDTTGPFPLIVGDNGYLYIGDGSNVHRFDGQTGANGTLYKNDLDLPRGYVITSFSKLKNYLVIFAYRDNGSGTSYNKSEATAFFWDMVSPSWTYQYDLSANYVNGGFNYNGTVGCFTSGRSSYIYSNRLTNLLIFDGSTFKTITTFTENPPAHKGVVTMNSVLYWNADGVIYSYGNQYSTQSGVLNRITECVDTGTGGVLVNMGGSALIASAGSNLHKFNTGYYFQAIFKTPKFPINFPGDSKGKINFIKVRYGSTVSGTNMITLNVACDSTTSTFVSSLYTIDNCIGVYYVDTSGNTFVPFDSIQLTGSWTIDDHDTEPPTIKAIEIHYENIKI